jgi:hypothetical protein
VGLNTTEQFVGASKSFSAPASSCWKTPLSSMPWSVDQLRVQSRDAPDILARWLQVCAGP